MRLANFSGPVSGSQHYRLEGVVHTTGFAGGFDFSVVKYYFLQLPHLPGAFPKPFLPLLCGGRWCSSVLPLRLPFESFCVPCKDKKQLFGIFSRKSTKSCVHYNPEIDKTGKKWGKPHFMGEKVGKSVVCLSANLRTGNQTFIPTDLETSKYSTKQQNFNLNGEYWGMFSALKAPENNRTHTTVILNHLHCSLLRYDICRIDKVYCSWITGAF